MLLTQEVEIVLQASNVKHFESLGYEIPRIKTKWRKLSIPRGTKITVNVKDLQEGSKTEIQCLCDYCLDEGKETIMTKTYNSYIKQNKKSVIHKDCCVKCISKKDKESNMLVYGVKHVTQIPVVLQKIKDSSKLDGQFVYNEFIKAGFEPQFKSENYENAHQLLPYICPKHRDKGIQYKEYNGIKYGRICYYCAIDNRSGEKAYQWKGGISNLQEYLRSFISEWKKDSMKSCNFKCVITGKRFDIIHHLYGFDQILQETINELNLPIYDQTNKYTDIELKQIKQLCLEKHYKYGLGVCLTNEEHDKFHLIYGYGNNTEEQFEKFKEKRLKEIT